MLRFRFKNTLIEPVKIAEDAYYNFLSNLRLRTAYGESGVQPGPTDALQLYSVNSASIRSTDQPVEQFNTLGNPDLKPERSGEWEGGLDARFFSNRMNCCEM